MVRGELDLSVVSSIEYARYPERYLILPDLSISCRGPVRSVLLLSQRPIAELSGRTILITSQSHTSVALLKILHQAARPESRFSAGQLYGSADFGRTAHGDAGYRR